MEAEGDGAPYPGCVTPLGVATLASLRAPTSTRSAWDAVGEGGRRLLLPPTYAGMEAEGDGAPYPGCVTPLGVATLASLRAPTSTRSAWDAVGEGGRRLLLPPTYAGMEAERDGAPYPGCVTPLGVATLASLRAPTSTRSAWNAVGEGGRRLRSAPTYAGMEAERDGAPYPGCVTPLGVATLASLRAPTSTRSAWDAVGEGGRRLRSAPTYAGMKAESAGTLYSGYLTPLGVATLASLRAPTSTRSAWNAVGEGGRRLRSAPTYAGMKAESAGTLYSGYLTPLGVATLASLRAPTSTRSAWNAVGEGGRRLRFLRRTPAWRPRAPERSTRAV